MGGWRDWGVGDAVVGWIKSWIYDLLEKCECQAWRSVRRGGWWTAILSVLPDHLEWVPELVSHSCNK